MANIYNINNGNGTVMNEIWLTAVIYSEWLTIYTVYDANGNEMVKM